MLPSFKIGYQDDGLDFWVSDARGNFTTEEETRAFAFDDLEFAQTILAKGDYPTLKWFTETYVGGEQKRFYSYAEMVSSGLPFIEPYDA